jgi:hypothetical protein
MKTFENFKYKKYDRHFVHPKNKQSSLLKNKTTYLFLFQYVQHNFIDYHDPTIEDAYQQRTGKQYKVPLES